MTAPSAGPSTGRDRERPTGSGADPGPPAGDGPDGAPPEIDDLRRRLRIERERSLNATDRILGAQAEAAQARAEIKELYHRLHVREAELAQLRELLTDRPPTGPTGVRGDVAGRLGRRGRWALERARSVARRLPGR